jgi:hypothetical protein
MFTIKQQMGISVRTGTEIKLKQFQVFFDNVLVGYLPYGAKSQIQALFNFPHDSLNDDVLVELGMVAAGLQEIESVTVEGPEQYSRQFVEAVRKAQEEESQDDE